MTLENKTNLIEAIEYVRNICNHLKISHDANPESDVSKWSSEAYDKLSEVIIMLDDDYWAHEDVDYLKERELMLKKDTDDR